MSHANAPLTPAGRLRLIEHCRHRPIAHAAATSASSPEPARFLAAHGIVRITRIVTDNGACYRSTAFTRTLAAVAHHQRIRPFTPRHNGKVERYQRILAEELLYARTWTSETHRAAVCPQAARPGSPSSHTATS